MTLLSQNKALILFSGGQDSATCLAWALDRYESVETIGFSYGQRHEIELACRTDFLPRISALKPEWKDRLGEDRIIDLSAFGQISESALTRDAQIAMTDEGLPTTFVPGRNLLFLTFAATVAYRRGIKNLVTGVCETDYSGYPDCRDDTIKALQLALNLGMARQFVLHTPLMWIDKAATWALAQSLGGAGLVGLIQEQTHTCYMGDRTVRHVWGYGCGTCPACNLRRDGWDQFNALA